MVLNASLPSSPCPHSISMLAAADPWREYSPELPACARVHDTIHPRNSKPRVRASAVRFRFIIFPTPPTRLGRFAIIVTCVWRNFKHFQTFCMSTTHTGILSSSIQLVDRQLFIICLGCFYNQDWWRTRLEMSLDFTRDKILLFFFWLCAPFCFHDIIIHWAQIHSYNFYIDIVDRTGQQIPRFR